MFEFIGLVKILKNYLAMPKINFMAIQIVNSMVNQEKIGLSANYFIDCFALNFVNLLEYYYSVELDYWKGDLKILIALAWLMVKFLELFNSTYFH